jgi:hypothetical protein
VQGDAGHPGEQGGGPKKNNQKKWRAEEEEWHKGPLIPQKTTDFYGRISTNTISPNRFTTSWRKSET